MKRLLYLTVILGLLAGAYWVGTHHGPRGGASHESSESRKVLYYVDPMNPAHTSDRPGLAPCGMKMEPVYADETGGRVGAPSFSPLAGTVKINPEKQQLIGMRLGTVELKRLDHTLRLLGKVAADETRIYRINATVDGWITKSLPFATGSRVKKDETLATFYSPEFLSAGQALLFALNSKDRAQAAGSSGGENPVGASRVTQFNINLQQYRDTLHNLGMGELQIEDMIQTRKFTPNVNLVSPSDGFVTLRTLSEGQRFEKGTEMFRITDLSRVWILADVFEKEAGLIPPDAQVKVALPAQGKEYTATLSKTLPQFDNVSRTLKLRFEADNPDFVLKPDMFLDVELLVRLPETLVVPADAVLDAGLRQTVFVDRGNGYFELRPVQTGLRFGDQVQITHGLLAGERIVVSGNFLLDSESRMKLAASGIHAAPATDPVCGMSVDPQKAREAKRLSEHQGATYYFCNIACKRSFDGDPASFLKGAAQRPADSIPAPAHASPEPAHH